MQNPDLTGSERFGVAANWGTFEDANGLGVSLMGVLGHNFLAQNDGCPFRAGSASASRRAEATTSLAGRSACSGRAKRV